MAMLKQKTVSHMELLQTTSLPVLGYYWWEKNLTVKEGSGKWPERDPFLNLHVGPHPLICSKFDLQLNYGEVLNPKHIIPMVDEL